MDIDNSDQSPRINDSLGSSISSLISARILSKASNEFFTILHEQLMAAHNYIEALEQTKEKLYECNDTLSQIISCSVDLVQEEKLFDKVARLSAQEKDLKQTADKLPKLKQKLTADMRRTEVVNGNISKWIELLKGDLSRNQVEGQNDRINCEIESTSSTKSAPTNESSQQQTPKKYRLSKRKYNPDKCCGVPFKGKPCKYSLTCKKHSIYEKREVEGRSKPFDELFEENRVKNQIKRIQNRSRMNRLNVSLFENNSSIFPFATELFTNQQQLSMAIDHQTNDSYGNQTNDSFDNNDDSGDNQSSDSTK